MRDQSSDRAGTAMVRPLAAWLGRTFGPPRGQGCTAATKRCDFWNWGERYVRPECCTAHLTDLAVFTHELLERHEIFHWLDDGALLGAVRNGLMIPWDTDVDFGAMVADRPRIEALADEVEQYGYFLDATDPVIIRINLSRINLQHADIFFWEESQGELCCTGDFPKHGWWPGMQDAPFLRSFLDPLGSVHLEGHAFPAPHPAELYLAEHLYGPDYLVPARPAATHDLRPLVDQEDLTPVVKRLLTETAELERRLFFLKSHPRLSQLSVWQRWTDSALPKAADPHVIEDLRASRACGRGPVVDVLLHSIAILTMGIDELEHSSATTFLRRTKRRAEVIGAKARRCLPGSEPSGP